MGCTTAYGVERMPKPTFSNEAAAKFTQGLV